MALHWTYGLCSCQMHEPVEDYAVLEIRLQHEEEQESKALLPAEEKISDISLMIFDGYGLLETYIYAKEDRSSFNVNLIKGARYSIMACVNFGYQTRIGSLDEAEDIVFHLAYPDEYRDGLPMTALLEDIVLTEDSSIDLGLERMMARISLKMDRSALSEGVSLCVTGVRIGNCPKKAKAFIGSRVDNEDDCFHIGFSHDDIDCAPLNMENMEGLSGEISLYMLENLQGRFADAELSYDHEKVFKEHDPRKDLCSYIEIEMDYSYKDMASVDKPLIYRFYLGEDLNSLDIERNCHYHITVCPEDDGLHGDGWRIDKSGIRFTGEPHLSQYPGDYIVGDIGERIHIGCNLTPSYAPLDIGLSYLEADKAEGIYDYEIDKDGHGVTLTLTGPGRGLIYMEAGDPINDAALFLIEVNKPDS